MTVSGGAGYWGWGVVIGLNLILARKCWKEMDLASLQNLTWGLESLKKKCTGHWGIEGQLRRGHLATFLSFPWVEGLVEAASLSSLWGLIIAYANSLAFIAIRVVSDITNRLQGLAIFELLHSLKGTNMDIELELGPNSQSGDEHSRKDQEPLVI